MMSVGIVESDVDLHGILALQRASREPTADGFVTVEHTLEILRAMHALMPSIVARDETGTIVAYALAMPKETRELLPILEPMFVQIERLPIAPRWYVMGQVAVAPAQRGTGVFDALYAEHRARHAGRFDEIVTEVSLRNARSLRAHERVGFRSVLEYEDATDRWAILAWRWV
jgi:hypothetical protein